MRNCPHYQFFTHLRGWKSLGATYLKDISVGGTAQYTSEHVVQEVIQALGETIFSPILSNVRQSPFFSVYIEETTDVSIKNELIVYSISGMCVRER